MKVEKNSNSAPEEPNGTTAVSDAPSPEVRTARSLASRIQQVTASELKPGTKVLYPGNKVIEVAWISLFRHILDERAAVYVVSFVGQSEDSFMAFTADAQIYIYND